MAERPDTAPEEAYGPREGQSPSGNESSWLFLVDLDPRADAIIFERSGGPHPPPKVRHSDALPWSIRVGSMIRSKKVAGERRQ
jgi:hypothetical protein